MRKWLGVLCGSVLLAGLLAIPPVSAHKAPNSCGDKVGTGAGWFDSYGHNVGCKKTRRVARRWERRCVINGSCREGRRVRIHVAPGFRCRYKDAGYEVVRVRCTAAGDRVVHFRWGS